MDENFISNENYAVSPMSDQHSTATISEKVVDVSNIGTFVMGEHNSSMITFQIDRYYDGIDLSDKKIKIVYKNSNGIYESDEAEICNVKYSQKSLRFSWIVSSNVTQTTKFIAYICFISEDYLLKTENFTVQVKSSFDPSTSEPSANWFITLEGKLEKIEKDIADNHVYDWAKQPEKPTYTPEEIGAEKAGTSDGIFRSSMKYTDGEISRLENTVIPNNVANIEQKITGLNQSVVNLQDVKAEKVHTHLVTDITDFPTSLPASDVYDWAKAETKPTYTYEEVGALSSSTHIPSTLEEMTDDQNHRTVSDVEKETWNAKSDFSGSYNDLTDVPEIKQLTDDLKEKYDNAATLATANKNTLDTDYAQTKEFLDGLKKGYIEYQLTWIENERVTSENGEIQTANGWKRTAYTDICDAAYIFVTSLSGEENVEGEFQFCGAWYDENHKFIEELSLQALTEYASVPPATAKYFILSYNQLSVGMMIGRRASIQEGRGATASGAFSHAEGSQTTASGSFSHVEGGYSTASGDASHAEGDFAKAIGYAAHAEGMKTSAEGENSHAEGLNTYTKGRSSHAEGADSSARGEDSHAEGYNTEATGNQSHAEGNSTTASKVSSHAEGDSTTASGECSHAEGRKSIASGAQSHAEGSSTVASQMCAHAEGNSTKASHQNAHAEGNDTTASGPSSHSEGTSTSASGSASHAEGQGTAASGELSHAEGVGTTAEGMCSHAEGSSTTAGECSHAEGSMTYAKGEISHAEGTNSHAVGSVSHAEGMNTLSEGKCSHAEGSNTEAKGKYSHASGFLTQATHSCQYAVGCGNDPKADSLFEVGNGLNAEGNLIDDTTTVFDLKTRRNAFRVTNTGYAIAQTALQIGETAITEGQLKQLIQLITNAG